jgi:hypothetical protein
MADGTTKPIEAVRIGDSVMSRNEQSGKTEAEPVSAVIRHGNTPTLTLALSDGDRVVTTAPHPFYVIGKGFTEARSLRAGEAIASRAGEPATITAIDHTAAMPVYNLTVDSDHTYFVGEAGGGLWVHNTWCGSPDPYSGDPFPGMSPRQGLHSPLKAPSTPYHNFPVQDPLRTALDPADLPPGTDVEDALRDAWNNPVAGGSVNPLNGSFQGVPGYPLNAAGDTTMELRIGSNGVHGWPVP